MTWMVAAPNLVSCFGPYTDPAVPRARARLAILAAQKVFPIFHAVYPDDLLRKS